VFGSRVNVDFNTLSVGLGYRHAISSNSDLFGLVSYEDIEVEASFKEKSRDVSDNGYGLQAGIRSLVTQNIELSGSITYIDIAEESETGFNVLAMYHLTNQFSVGAGYSKTDDVDSLSLSAVLFF